MNLHILSDLHLEFGDFVLPETCSCHDLMVNGTRLISNQRGYVRHEEVADFKDDLVVSVG